MPYSKKKNYQDCEGIAVVKDSDGKVMGCHETDEKADAQITALNISEHKEADTELETKMAVPIGNGPMSFQEIDAMEEAHEQQEKFDRDLGMLPMMKETIVYSEMDDGEKSNKFQNILKELGDRFNNMIGMGQKQKQADTEQENDTPESAKETRNGMYIYKDKDTGVYNWIATYSNHYRDDDSPPEIISAKAHQNFIKSVESGETPYPELWLWHTPEWKCGQANWLGWDDKGFAIAAGYFDNDASEIAEALMKAQDVKVSHGMPRNTIVKDSNDPTVIIQYKSIEISALPGFAAANRWTGFSVLSEEQKMIDETQKQALTEKTGIPAAALDAIEQRNAQTASKNAEIGIESKEKDAETEAVAEEVQAQPEVTEPETEKKPEYANRDEVVEVMVGMQQQINALAEAVKSLSKSDEEKVAEKAAETPIASLQAIVSMRASQAEENKMKQGERTNGPKQTDPGNYAMPGIVDAIKTGNWLEALNPQQQ